MLFGDLKVSLLSAGKRNAIKLGVRGFVRICIETCARGNVIGNTDSEKRAC